MYKIWNGFSRQVTITSSDRKHFVVIERVFREGGGIDIEPIVCIILSKSP